MRAHVPIPRLLLCALVLLAPFSSAPLSFARAAEAPSFTALDEAVEKSLAATGTPGAAVVVVAGGRIVHLRGYGTTDAEGGPPVEPNTLFRLGSTSKAFVALAAAKLAAEGKLDLAVPVGRYAPELHPAVARVTLHQLLSHTAGLADEAPMEGPRDESALAARVRGWDASAFFAEPGEVFSYANPGYVLAGYVLERIAGRPFAEVVHEQVLAPLGMTRSTYRPLEAFTWPVALGHDRGENGPRVLRPFPEHAGNYPPGSLFSSAEEMGRFLLALLGQGRVAELQALPPAAIETVASQHATIAVLDRAYGYGLELRRERGHRVVGHSGARLGYGSIFFTVPDHGVGGAILANSTGAIYFDAARQAISLLVAPAEGQTAAPAAEIPRAMSAEEMARYAARYVNNDRIRAELAVVGGKLMLQAMGGSVEVQKTGETAFRATGAGPCQSFRLLPAGEARYLTCEHWAMRRADG